jgi:hypothetical protein
VQAVPILRVLDVGFAARGLDFTSLDFDFLVVMRQAIPRQA